jgi:hypothetical protein
LPYILASSRQDLARAVLESVNINDLLYHFYGLQAPGKSCFSRWAAVEIY